MISVTVYRCAGDLVGIGAQGHAGYAEYGNDIVCAAVSALLQALLVGLQDVAETREMGSSFDAESGEGFISWPREEARRLSLLGETIARSLAGIQMAYPRYMQMKEEQVDDGFRSSNFRS
jgi:uncharacterized protein YsxB (DUF464 family)